MRILYTARTVYDRLYLALDGLYAGTPLEIVLAMKRTTVFGEHAPLDQYLAFHRLRLARAYHYQLSMAGTTPDARATAFLQALLAVGIVTRWPEHPKGQNHD